MVRAGESQEEARGELPKMAALRTAAREGEPSPKVRREPTQSLSYMSAVFLARTSSSNDATNDLERRRPLTLAQGLTLRMHVCQSLSYMSSIRLARTSFSNALVAPAAWTCPRNFAQLERRENISGKAFGRALSRSLERSSECRTRKPSSKTLASSIDQARPCAGGEASPTAPQSPEYSSSVCFVRTSLSNEQMADVEWMRPCRLSRIRSQACEPADGACGHAPQSLSYKSSTCFLHTSASNPSKEHFEPNDRRTVAQPFEVEGPMSPQQGTSVSCGNDALASQLRVSVSSLGQYLLARARRPGFILRSATSGEALSF
mmetsp:Transcript_114077/g.322603  ORF Transcript_114077/g.322603 Transcript_114077/m.322603 type:complete len:318 (-) Transcript_114077:532-1485(-)